MSWVVVTGGQPVLQSLAQLRRLRCAHQVHAGRRQAKRSLSVRTLVSTEVTASRRRTVCSLLRALLPSAPSIAANDSTANRLKMGSRCLGAAKNRWSKVGSVSGGGSIRRRCS